MKTKVYKVLVWYKKYVELLVEETNENEAKEIAKDFVRKTFEYCIIDGARIIETAKTINLPDFVINKKYPKSKGE
jgi:hypothetical protein